MKIVEKIKGWFKDWWAGVVYDAKFLKRAALADPIKQEVLFAEIQDILSCTEGKRSIDVIRELEKRHGEFAIIIGAVHVELMRSEREGLVISKVVKNSQGKDVRLYWKVPRTPMEIDLMPTIATFH